MYIVHRLPCGSSIHRWHINKSQANSGSGWRISWSRAIWINCNGRIWIQYVLLYESFFCFQICWSVDLLCSSLEFWRVEPFSNQFWRVLQFRKECHARVIREVHIDILRCHSAAHCLPRHSSTHLYASMCRISTVSWAYMFYYLTEGYYTHYTFSCWYCSSYLWLDHKPTIRLCS